MTQDPEDGSSLLDKAYQWLTQTGFPLEMRAAEQFRKAAVEPTFLQQGSNYVDSSTGKVRETDVEVLWLGMTEHFHSISLTIIVECKSGSQPWILFADPDASYVDVPHYGLAVAASSTPGGFFSVDDIHERFINLGIPLFEGPNALCTGIVQMKRHPKDAKKDAEEDRNEAYDAVRQAASGAAASVFNSRPSREPLNLRYSVPVVVTSHPIVQASLNENGSIEVVEAEAGCMLVRPEAYDDSILVHVVHETGLPRFVQICAETADTFERVAAAYGGRKRISRAVDRVVRRLRRP